MRERRTEPTRIVPFAPGRRPRSFSRTKGTCRSIMSSKPASRPAAFAGLVSSMPRTTALAFSLLIALPVSLSRTAIAQEPPTKQDAPADRQMAEFLRGSTFQDFLQRDGGAWNVEWNAATGTPRAIWGSGIALVDWRGNSIDEARRHAQQLLQQNATLLRLGTSEFREVIGSRMGRTWSFVFDQFFRGLPVIGGRADVRVNMTGRVPMFGSTAWQIANNFDVVPTIGDDTALAIAWQKLGEAPTGARQPAPIAAPRLVIWGDTHAPQPMDPRLAWEVAISNVDRSGNGAIGRYYVDAKTGAVLRFENDKHQCSSPSCARCNGTPAAAPLALPVATTVTVNAWTRTGLDGFSALVNTPMPGLELNVPGIGTVTTNQSGQFTINITTPVSITVGALDGRHHAAMIGSDAPGGTFTVNPGVATTIQLLTSGATPEQAAHPTVSWWTDKTNEFLRSILGNTTQLDTANAIVPTVNIALTCNAYYVGNSINFYAAGGSCNNTGFSTVVSHEWGHGLDDRYGGISQIDGLSEAWGDITAFYLADDPTLGSGFSTAGVGIRSGNNTAQYPVTGGVHAMGQTFMGFAWKLRDRLATTLGSRPTAITITNDIVLGSIVANATDQQGAVLEVFVADDDDGNLANQTPHWADLLWACNQHSLPYPGAPSTVPNDLCDDAIPLVNGINGPFTNVGALTSTPAWPCGTGTKDVWFTYSTVTPGTLTVQTCGQATWDTEIQIFSGTCASLTSLVCNDDTCSLQSSATAAINAGTYYIRVGGYNNASGTFSVDVSGPGGILAASAPFGAGCYRRSTAFYELATGANFDLANTAMRLVKNGDTYTAQAGGTYVAPTAAATQLTLTDDAEVTVNLTGSFPYPGGSTSSLVVCGNGFVSVATGNGTDYSPTAAEWLASPLRRYGTWHDFNPNAAGSGKVKFQQVGSIAYVTWDGVYSYNTTAANTWQLQFDLTNGNVTYAWQTMVASGSDWLIGATGPTPNDDLGSIDISTALPGTFLTGPTNLQPLTLASTLPKLGQTLTLTTTQFPPGSALGIQIMSVTRYDPGVELGFVGMPKCFLFLNTDVLATLVASGGQASWNWAVPTGPSWFGLQVTAQSVAFAANLNSAGIISTNGVALTLGL